MSDQHVWSINLGRWGQVPVRVHMFFLLFAAFTLYLGWLQADVQQSFPSVLGGLAGVTIIVLFLSVLAHEFGHYLIALRLGGGADQIVLGPLGGMAAVRVPYDPRSEVVAVLAGPLVNLIICLLSMSVCLFMAQSSGQELRVVDWLNPLAPGGLMIAEGAAEEGFHLLLWINWMLFLVNIVPAFPFDGARALLAVLAMTPHAGGTRRSMRIVVVVAKLVPLGLLIAAWTIRKQHTANAVLPPWFALVLLSIFLYFSARSEENHWKNEETEEELFGYDFSQGYTSLEEPEETISPPKGALVKWLERRREKRLCRQRAVEAEEDQRMDEILARLHETGIENLSAEDRALLHRVAARYRSREQK